MFSVIKSFLILTRNNIHHIALTLMVIVYVITFSVLSIIRHDAFYSYFDLANMDHTLWSTLNGNFFSFLLHENIISRFAIHSDLILVLLSPLYVIWDNVRILLIAQSFFLGIAAVPLFGISNHILKSKSYALVISAIYLITPSVQWINMYDFHGIALVIPFFLSAYYCALKNRWRWYWLFIGLALITKENSGLIVMMMGLILAIFERKRRVGVATALVGLAWFLIMVLAVIPYFAGTTAHWAFVWYNVDFPMNSATADPSPLRFFGVLEKYISPYAFEYYEILLKQFGFIPLLGFPILVFAFSELSINVLSEQGTMRTIFFHYDSGLIPFLVLSSIYGLKFVQLITRKITRLQPIQSVILPILLGIMAIFAIRMNYFYSPLPTTPSCWCYMYQVSEEDKEFEDVLQKIPKDASITASNEIRPHVNHRHLAYYLPQATDSAQFIALITHNRLVGNREPKEYELQLIKVLQEKKTHIIRHKSEHFYLFERK